VTSGSDYITAIYKFTTGIKGVAITISGQDRFTMGMIIGSMIFLLIGFILFRRKRRR
jgi:lipopolysaccharide export LptBFGC system permease protein LptF